MNSSWKERRPILATESRLVRAKALIANVMMVLLARVGIPALAKNPDYGTQRLPHKLS